MTLKHKLIWMWIFLLKKVFFSVLLLELSEIRVLYFFKFYDNFLQFIAQMYLFHF